MVDDGLQLKFLKSNPGLESGPFPDVVIQRNNSIAAISDEKSRFDWLTRIDTLIEYASSLCSIVQNDSTTEEDKYNFKYEIAVSLINAASYNQDISLDMMQRAYGLPMSDAIWSKSGIYLKRGLGLIQWVEQQFSSSFTQETSNKLFKVLNEVSLEFEFLQQIGIVVLSLSKLRSKVYKNQRDAVLDFQEEDLRDLSSNSVLYAKLVIGCYETALKCSNDEGSIINKPLIIYLNSLMFLLLSLDQYSKNQCGIAIGMIEEAIASLSKIVPKSQLNDSILSKKRKRDILKNAFHKKTSSSSSSNNNIDLLHPSFTFPSRKSKNHQLLPLLRETLDDFLIPLSLLLNYRYQQTNEKLTFQPVEKDESSLRKLFPRGKAPELRGSQWIFNHDLLKLQEIDISISSPNSHGYY